MAEGWAGVQGKGHQFDVAAVPKEVVYAFKALAKGEATPGQQGEVLRVLRENLCMTGGLAYLPGNPDGSAFIAGRQYVGLRVQKLIKTEVRG